MSQASVERRPKPHCPGDEPPRKRPAEDQEGRDAIISRRLVQPAPTAEDLNRRPGFNCDFLAEHVPEPTFDSGIRHDAVPEARVLRYEHFSLAMSASRRMARWVAWNIDGSHLWVDEDSLSREGLDFRNDPRLEDGQQILNDQYQGKENPLDRGHISRRADLLWGDLEEAARANYDSFYYPNITPQMDVFNRSSEGGLWGCLENALLTQIDLTDHRVSVFGGPVLAIDDKAHLEIQVPDDFWKVFIYVAEGEPRAKGFLLTQSLRDLERREIELPEWEPYEKSVSELSSRTSLDFGVVQEWDRAHRALDRVDRPVRDLAEIRW